MNIETITLTHGVTVRIEQDPDPVNPDEWDIFTDEAADKAKKAKGGVGGFTIDEKTSLLNKAAASPVGVGLAHAANSAAFDSLDPALDLVVISSSETSLE